MLLVLSTMFALAQGRAYGAGGSGTNGMLTVQRIEVQVVRSAPPQAFVHVHGVVLNGCTTVGAIEQHRDDKAITVTISTHTTGEVCTMIAQLVDEKVRLEGEFTTGSYTVNVNGVVVHFTI
jgi:hypothetical protein